MDDLETLCDELVAKAWASTRWRTGKTPSVHVCSRAADKIRQLANAPVGQITLVEVREIFTRRLNLTYDQRAYSWHEIQDALSEVDRVARLPAAQQPEGKS